jgi:hypothetical protein
MVADPDPIVLDILYETFEDDGLYLGVPRDGNCLRCIKMGGRLDKETLQMTINPAPGSRAFCRQCMDDDLDRSQAVRRIMFGLRRRAKG